MFVSAVTHELRTPLTTFRLYTDMMAEGMVPTEERRREYLRRLQSESQRLGHLVENVLFYARLEGGRAAVREALDVRDVVEATLGPSCASARRAPGWSWRSAPTSADDTGAGRPLGARADPREPRRQRRQIRGAVEPAAVDVELRSRRRPRVCRVRDHGPGLTARTGRASSAPSRSPIATRPARPASAWGWPSAGAWPGRRAATCGSRTTARTAELRALPADRAGRPTP